MRVTSLSFENMHEHGELFINFLRARKRAFIERNNWDLPEAMGMEYDQYDTPASRWIAVHEGDKILAGVRLTPTTARCGIYSYMIRDAQLGLVDSIPSDLLDFEAPIDPQIWESSRVFVMESVPARLRTRVQAAMMQGLIDTARDLHARVVFGLVPAVWSRWIGRLGLIARPVGPVLNIDGWETQVALMHLQPADDDAVADARPPWLKSNWMAAGQVSPAPEPTAKKPEVAKADGPGAHV